MKQPKPPRSQHFLQQHLLKGFSFNWPAEPCHVWAYRHNGNIFKPATKGYGAERDFYGDPRFSDLDRRIGVLENTRFNAIIARLRNGADGDVSATDASDLVIHVLHRSKNVRSMFIASAEPLIGRGLTLMEDSELQRRLVLKELRTKPNLLLDKLGHANSKPVVRKQAWRRIKPQINTIAKQLLESHTDEISACFDTIRSRLKSMLTEGHNRSLARNLTNFVGTRLNHLRSLRWRVVTTDADLILGDSGTFVELANSAFKPMSEPNDHVAAVWLPLSYNRVLLGSAEESLVHGDVARINLGAARCSFDSFCARHGPDHHRALVSEIRKSTFSLSSEAIDSMASRSVEDLLS